MNGKFSQMDICWVFQYPTSAHRFARTDERTDGPTDRRTDRHTDRPTDRRTDGRDKVNPLYPPPTFCGGGIISFVFTIFIAERNKKCVMMEANTGNDDKIGISYVGRDTCTFKCHYLIDTCGGLYKHWFFYAVDKR